MDIFISFLITMSVILVFLCGVITGVILADENSKEKRKARMRKTEAYKLGVEETKEFYYKDNPQSHLKGGDESGGEESDTD